MAGIRLIHITGEFLFKSFSVFNVWVSCRFKIIFLNEPLYSTKGCFGFFNKAIFNKFDVDQSSINPWELLFETKYLFYSSVRKNPGHSRIRTNLWHKTIHTISFVKGFPFFKSIVFIKYFFTLRVFKWFFCNFFVVCSFCTLRK